MGVTYSDPSPAEARGARITYLVKQLELVIRADMDVMAREFGITALQYTALTVLQRHPGMSGAQLARRSFVSAQAGSDMIATLERKGLITRAPDQDNRRILRVTLTKAGNDVVEACEERMNELERQMLSGVSPRAAQEFQTTLNRCVGALQPGSDKRSR